MKKVLFSVLCLVILSNAALATEPSVIEDAVAKAVEKKPVQGVEIENSGAVLVLGKQPQTQTSIQYIKIKKCGLVGVVLLNGKVKEQ